MTPEENARRSGEALWNCQQRIIELETALAALRALPEHIWSAPAETWGVNLGVIPDDPQGAYMLGADVAIRFSTKAIKEALADV